MKTDFLFKFAWKIVPKLPPSFVDACSKVVADIVAATNPASVQQLRRNQQRLLGRPVSKRDVRDGVRSYFRCFAQQFSLPGWSKERLERSCVYPQAQATAELMKDGPVVLALTHTGNWDLAGAWFSALHGKILTVAEKLEPESLFDDFVDFRNSLGMEIIGVGKNEHIFEKLVESARGRPLLVPLLADRDISGAGIEVQLGSAKALVAAGPAALALRLQRPLIAGVIQYKKIDGEWRIYAHFTDPIDVPQTEPDETEVEALTKAWVRAIEAQLKTDFVDWHMMQKLYVEDLDPKRLERARARARKQEGAQKS